MPKESPPDSFQDGKQTIKHEQQCEQQKPNQFTDASFQGDTAVL